MTVSPVPFIPLSLTTMGLLSNAIAGKLVEKALSSKSKPAVSPAPGAPGAAPQQDALGEINCSDHADRRQDGRLGAVQDGPRAVDRDDREDLGRDPQRVQEGMSQRATLTQTTGKDVPIPDKS